MSVKAGGRASPSTKEGRAEARLNLARQMLDLAKEQRAPPETIAFWEQADFKDQADLTKYKPHRPPV